MAVSFLLVGNEMWLSRYSEANVDMLNLPYDYGSIMHYFRTAYSRNGLPTIETIQPNVAIGQLVNMSAIDIQKIRLFYNCPATGVTFAPTTLTPPLNDGSLSRSHRARHFLHDYDPLNSFSEHNVLYEYSDG